MLVFVLFLQLQLVLFLNDIFNCMTKSCYQVVKLHIFCAIF